MTQPIFQQQSNINEVEGGGGGGLYCWRIIVHVALEFGD